MTAVTRNEEAGDENEVSDTWDIPFTRISYGGIGRCNLFVY
jgi:hypothetical protein